MFKIIKFFKLLLFAQFFLYFFIINVFSQEFFFSNIKILGNKNISNESILSIANIDNSAKKYDIENLNLIKKKLFESNFFSNVDVNISDKTLVISVIENPLVDYIVIEGLNKRPDFEQKLNKILILKSNSIFSQTSLNKDIFLIKEFLSDNGFFGNVVNYNVNKTTNNKVNIFYKIDLKNQYKIKNIFFIGDKVFSSSKLSSIISSEPDSIFKIFGNEFIPSVNRINYDISSLKNFYLNEGYYDVQIPGTSFDLLNDEYVNLVFSIDAGPKFFINKIYIKNASDSVNETDLIYIQEENKKILNKPYNLKIINRLVNNYNLYLDKKELRSTLNLGIKKVTNEKLDLTLEIVPISDKKIISNIKVIGNEVTEEKVIRNNLKFAEGDLLNSFKIQQSVDQLKSTRIFKDAIISNTINNNQNYDLTVKVEEIPTGEIAGGLGVGSAGSTIAFNINEKNFLGKGIRTDANVNLGTQRILGSISFDNPDFMDTGTLLSNSLYANKYTYSDAGYENKLIGNDISTGYEIFENINFTNGIGINYDKINVSSGASSLITGQEGNYLTTKYFYRLTNDQRNRKYKATSGHLMGFGQDIAIPPSDITYISNNFYGSLYKEFTEDFVGSIKYNLKSINSLNDKSIKLSDRVFLSDTELRGFAFRSVGPKVNGDYIGGNYAYATTFSTTVPNGLPDSWNASSNLFLDIANVWGSDLTGVKDNDSIRSSIGFGFTWFSPIGPLSLSYAEPIAKASSDAIENFNFRIGGAF